MKKYLCLFILISSTQFTFSQETKMDKDTIDLKEVIVQKSSNRKEMIAIIKKIKNNIRENYNLDPVNYLTNHFSIKDDKDTLVNRKTNNTLNVKYLSQSTIHSALLDDPKNPFHTDSSPYIRFEPSVTNNNHWLYLSIFYESLHVLDFDFFDLNKDYKYQISKEANITKVTFIATKYYSGYFTFNNVNYNLIRIAFKNTKPYDYLIWGKSNSSFFEFESRFKYNKVTVLLDFTDTEKGKLLLTKLDAMEELTQFQFKRFNESKVQIDQGRGIKFYTTLNMRILK